MVDSAATHRRADLSVVFVRYWDRRRSRGPPGVCIPVRGSGTPSIGLTSLNSCMRHCEYEDMNRSLSGHITTLASIFPRTGSTSSTPSADSQRSPIPLLPSGPGFTAGARRPAGLRGDQRLRRAFAVAGCARRSAGAPPQPAACLAFCAVAEPPQDRPRRRRHACPDGGIHRISSALGGQRPNCVFMPGFVDICSLGSKHGGTRRGCD